MKTYTIPYADIKVSFDRKRKDLGNIEGLVESLKKYKQLMPIIITQDNELVDGYRRYTALGRAGINEALVIQREDVDELLFRELELEANIQRKDITWQERVESIAEVHRLRQMRDPNWSQPQTAIIMDTHQPMVSQALNMARMMELFPEIKGAKSLHQATSWAKHKAATIERVIDVAASPQLYRSIENCIHLGDSVDLIKTIPDETFNAIITDPPFGINYNNRKTNKAGFETAYADDAEAYERLLTMAPDLYRVLKPNGWFVWFFGMSWYARCVEVFESAGFTVDPLPIVWDRSGGKCHTNRPDHYMARAYDVALHCHKGDPQMVLRGKPNVIKVDPVGVNDRELMVERPVELYAEIIRRLTVPGEYVADFFVGSGSCAAACAQLQRKYWGSELDPERRAVAIKKIYAHTPEITRLAPAVEG